MSELAPASEPSCPECAIARTGSLPGGARVLRRGAFVVHPRPEPSPVPGWLVVAPARHVEQIDALTPDEQRALGPLLAEVAAAVRAETPCEKVYVSVFAEILPHLHVHVIARPPGLGEEERGARLFASTRRADESERINLFRRVQSRLAKVWAGQAPGGPVMAGQGLAGRSALPAKGLFSGPWRAVLLSAAVCPGVGQLAQKRYGPGLAMLGATLALVFVLLARVVREAIDRIPTDPVGLDPLFAFGLAAEIQRANAGFFAWITAALVLLWVISIADAWLAQR
ncbi:MAG: HIT family protein [Solirubrobacterales bacterium]